MNVSGRPPVGVKVWCGPSRSIIFDEGVFAIDVCPPGMMCKLQLSVVKPVLLADIREYY